MTTTIQQENDYTDALFAYQDRQQLENALLLANCAKAEAYKEDACVLTYGPLGFIVFAFGALGAAAFVLGVAASGFFFIPAIVLAGISAALNEKREEIDFLRHVKALDRLRAEIGHVEFSRTVDRLCSRDGFYAWSESRQVWDNADRPQQ